MKKILFSLFLFLSICIPSFSSESISVPDINVNEAKKIITIYMMDKGWSYKNETDYLLSFEKTSSRYVGPSTAEINQYRYMKEHSEYPNDIREPDGHYETYTVHSQFIITENSNSVTIKTSSDDVLKILFSGYYVYNIKYEFPLFKRHIVISDTPQTNYTGMNRISKKTKITKINDKNVKDYTKKEIENIFNNCTEEKLKLKSDSGKVYYILRTFIEPTYKQYL